MTYTKSNPVGFLGSKPTQTYLFWGKPTYKPTTLNRHKSDTYRNRVGLGRFYLTPTREEAV